MTPSERLDIPLFPLHAVLFPGGVLPLRVFEQRYLDMAAACMKERAAVRRLPDRRRQGGRRQRRTARGRHAGGNLRVGNGTARHPADHRARRPTLPHSSTRAVGTDQLLTGSVEIIPDDGPQPLPGERRRLLPLLRRIAGELGPERMPEPHRFDDAEWVGYRLTEILPVQNLAKQKLLELEDPLARLEILERFLDQRKLLD